MEKTGITPSVAEVMKPRNHPLDEAAEKAAGSGEITGNAAEVGFGGIGGDKTRLKPQPPSKEPWKGGPSDFAQSEQSVSSRSEEPPSSSSDSSEVVGGQSAALTRIAKLRASFGQFAEEVKKPLAGTGAGVGEDSAAPRAESSGKSESSALKEDDPMVDAFVRDAEEGAKAIGGGPKLDSTSPAKASNIVSFIVTGKQIGRAHV